MGLNPTLSYLWISLSKIPANKGWQIYNTYGDFVRFWEEFSPKMEKIFGGALYSRLMKNKNITYLEDALVELEKKAIVFLTYESLQYPLSLKNIPYPPLSLYVSGPIDDFKHPYQIAMIGSRHPSRYGEETCFSIANSLSKKGVTIVSGLAMGIDAAAHRGALEAKGKTIAVLGNGLDIYYPKSNEGLIRKMKEEKGLIITEYAMGTEPIGYHFPQRNRIISGLSSAIVFVEGKIKSGGMVTVRHGLDQGKEVFALPGDIGKIGSEGPNMILREGARIITCAQDILEDLGWTELLSKKSSFDNKKAESNYTLSKEQEKIFQCLLKEECSFEQLAKKCDLKTDILSVNLTIMEIEGIIKKSPGNTYHMVNH